MRIRALRRYPVKSMLGEEIDAVPIGERGLQGDRVVAAIDRETGKVASAKNPRLWRGLLALRGLTAASGGVHLVLEDGRRIAWDDPAASGLLSELLGRDVVLTDRPPAEPELERSDPDAVLREGIEREVEFTVSRTGSAAPPGTFFDFAPVHLVAVETLRALGQQAERYRPNIVLETGADEPFEPFAENGWLGRRVRVGTAELEVIALTPRCAVPTLAHGALGRDPDALRAPAARNRVAAADGMTPLPCVGAYARVLRPGEARVGDPAEVSAAAQPGAGAAGAGGPAGRRG